MAIKNYDPLSLTPPEKENDPSIIGSVAAGIATGLIRIPQGAASLFASLYDLTNDTDTAQEVEEWFDKNVYNKLGATLEGQREIYRQSRIAKGEQDRETAKFKEKIEQARPDKETTAADTLDRKSVV